MQTKELLDEIKSMYENSPLPFAVLGRKFELEYANEALLNIYPEIKNTIVFYELFSKINKDALKARLLSQKSCELVCTVGDKENVHILFNAIIEDSEIQYITAASTLISYSEAPSEMPALSPQQISREFQDRIAMMFSAIYALCHSNELELTPRACDYLNSINQNCYNLLRSADNFTRLSMLREHSDKITVKKFDLKYFLDRLYPVIAMMDNKNRVPIKFECNEKIVPVCADLSRLEFVISNLILNSVKYTKPGNEIKITLEISGKNAVLTVNDKGEGIEQEILSKIGKEQVSFGKENENAGLGVALLISKEYMQSMGGSLSVISRQGEGTSVSVSLPIYNFGSKETALDDLTVIESPPVLNPQAKYSVIKVQLSEVCFYPIL